MACRSLIVLALLVAASPGAAGAVTLTVIASPQGPITPEQETGDIEFEVVVDCSSLALRTLEEPTGMAVTQGTVATMDVLAPDGSMVSGATSIVIPGCEAGEETSSSTGAISIIFRRDIPGYNDYNIEMTAAIPESELDQDSSSDSASTTVRSGFFGLVQADIPRKIVQTTGGDTPFHVTLSNHGNTPIQVTPELIEADPAEAGDWFAGVQPVDLAIGVPEPSQQELPLTFQVPTGSRLEAVLTFQFTGAHASEAGSTEPTSISLLLRRVSAIEESPAPPMWLSLTLATLAAVGLRRRA